MSHLDLQKSKMKNNWCQQSVDENWNIDKTYLALDGGTGQRGKQPPTPKLAKHFQWTEWQLQRSVFSAALEAIPPPFQSSIMTQSNETMCLKVDILQFIPNITGIFGCNTINVWPVTFVMIPKGVIDDKEFQKYIFWSIMHLYPDDKNKKGKKFMVKVDSEPGCSMEIWWHC